MSKQVCFYIMAALFVLSAIASIYLLIKAYRRGKRLNIEYPSDELPCSGKFYTVLFIVLFLLFISAIVIIDDIPAAFNSSAFDWSPGADIKITAQGINFLFALVPINMVCGLRFRSGYPFRPKEYFRIEPHLLLMSVILVYILFIVLYSVFVCAFLIL